MEHLRLTADERAWLEKRCPYFKSSYLDYLQSFQFKPAEQVTLNLTEDSDLELAISGNWAGTILYETPLMALISQTYFEHVDTKWDYVGQKRSFLFNSIPYYQMLMIESRTSLRESLSDA